MYIRGAKIDDSTLQRWVIKCVPLIDQEVRKRKRPVGNSWRMDETYVKLKGKIIGSKKQPSTFENFGKLMAA